VRPLPPDARLQQHLIRQSVHAKRRARDDFGRRDDTFACRGWWRNAAGNGRDGWGGWTAQRRGRESWAGGWRKQALARGICELWRLEALLERARRLHADRRGGLSAEEESALLAHGWSAHSKLRRLERAGGLSRDRSSRRRHRIDHARADLGWRRGRSGENCFSDRDQPCPWCGRREWCINGGDFTHGCTRGRHVSLEAKKLNENNLRNGEVRVPTSRYVIK
jgi:hypothetical protein